MTIDQSMSLSGYNIIIVDKSVTIQVSPPASEKTIMNQDYFTQIGNSQSFVCGISGSSGISEANIEVYAIPTTVTL